MQMSLSPITQVSQTTPHANLQPHLLTRLLLDLRGHRFLVERDTIMNLPESVLLCLFPNGLVLSRQSAALSDGDNEEEEEVYTVDVSFHFELCHLLVPVTHSMPSLIQIAFHTSSISSGTHPKRSMAPLATLVYSPHSSTLSTPLPSPTSARQHLRTPCFLNRRSLCLEKS
jgi:hypothetical protein